MTTYDLLVIGGGTAGIIAALGAAGVGARVLVAEEDRTGGDCLWTGCVPSKTLLAAARRAHDLRTADRVGLAAVEPTVDLARVMAKVHEAIARIEPQDSPDTLRAAGAEVMQARARFVAPGVADVGGRRVRWRAALIATGSRPAIPALDGLDHVDALTSDDVWKLQALPERLVVVGGGTTGSELGQAFARLGSEVTIVEREPRILPTADPEAAAVVADVLTREGVEVMTSTSVDRVRPGALDITGSDGSTTTLKFDRVLVATGRTPRTEDLGLDDVGVRTDASGFVAVDATMRSSGRNVFAAGDVTGWMPFTHVAAEQAGLVVANALFRLRRRFRPHLTPWAVFTDPEAAQVGLDERSARSRWGDDVVVARHDHATLDRAITMGRHDGFAKLVADPRGRLVGATLVGEAAGESIAEVAAWLRSGSSLRDVAGATHAYPTMTEGAWRAAVHHAYARMSTPRARRLAAGPLWLLRHLDVPR